LRERAQTAAVRLGRAPARSRRGSDGAREHARRWPATGAPGRAEAGDPSWAAGLQPSTRLAGRGSPHAVRVLLRPWARNDVAEHERIRRTCGSVRWSVWNGDPRRAGRQLAARAARTRGRDGCMDRASGRPAGRACAPEARAASRRSGRFRQPGAACSDPERRSADSVAATERVAPAAARARPFDAALEAGPAPPDPHIATVGRWRVLV